jgi:hypothetical protein
LHSLSYFGGIRRFWELSSIFALETVIDLGFVMNGFENSTIGAEFPCSADFFSIVICSQNCPIDYVADASLTSVDVMLLGAFQKSATSIDGGPVWFSCFGSFV